MNFMHSAASGIRDSLRSLTTLGFCVSKDSGITRKLPSGMFSHVVQVSHFISMSWEEATQ